MRSWMLHGAVLFGLLGALACNAEERDFGSGGSGGTGGDASGGGGSGGSTGEGPQLVSSTPADGDDQASIEALFFLKFDRPVSFASAAGKISVTSDVVTEPTFVQTLPCPDNDVQCIAGVYPEAFLDAAGHLLGGTKHTITIDKSFADSDGKVNDVDTVVSYITFTYKLDFVDDSGTLQEESGGIDYDPGSQSLFVCGLDSFNNSYFIIRRIQLANGNPTMVSTAAQPSTAGTGGPLCYGMDVFQGKLYASGTYSDRVFVYSNLQNPQLAQPQIMNATPFMAPNDKLAQVQSTALLPGMPGLLLFGAGYYHGGDKLTQLLAFDLAAGGYSVWLDAMSGFMPDAGFTVAPGIEAGHPYLYVADESTRMISKFDALNRARVNQQEFDDLYSAQMRTDSKGRLYVGTNSGLHVYETSGPDGFTEIATRGGLRAGRFGLREEGNNVHVYFMDFRSAAVIGTTEIKFVN